MKIKIFFTSFFMIVSLFLPILMQAQELQKFTFQSNHMGTQFSIILYAPNESVAESASAAAFYRVEELNQMMSDYIEDSELNRLSRLSSSNEAIKVNAELFELVKESIWISEMTDGLFDVTIGPLTHTWRMIRMMPEPVLPTVDELQNLLQRVGYNKIKLNDKSQTVKLDREDMQLDVGGIAKGYAAEEAIRILKTFGIYSALVDAGGDIAGGDITVSEAPSGRNAWEIAVPRNVNVDEVNPVFLQLVDKTVTTSGDMFQYIEINGTRYSHIINPKTGLGFTDQLQTTVISNKGTYADAFASVLTMMNPEDGIALINQIENTEAIIFQNRDDEIMEWMSEGFQKYMK